MIPPAIRFSREAVLNAAYQLVRRDGPAALNARAVARELGGSTQPIFRLFSNMEELRREVIALADRNFCTSAKKDALQSNDPYHAICMSYLLFARDEPQLFQLLFMRDRISEGHLSRQFNHFWACPVLLHSIDVDQDMAYKLYERTFYYTHGLAVAIATRYIPCKEEDEMHSLVTESIHAAADQLGIELRYKWSPMSSDTWDKACSNPFPFKVTTIK